MIHKQKGNDMKCPYCKSDLKEGTTALTFQMGPDHIVVVPPWICEQCAGESVDMSVSKKVERQVEQVNPYLHL